MKALLQLAIEIDFDKIIDNDTLDGLKKFTGAQTKEGIGKFYMDSLAKAIIDENLRKEHIAYNVEGSIVPDAELQNDEQVAELKDYDLVDVVSEVSSNDNFVQEEQKDTSLVDKMYVFMEQVSVHKGIPVGVKMTAEVFDAFLCQIPNHINDDERFAVTQTTWMGLPVKRVNDDSIVVSIDYKSFETNTIETEYMSTLSRTL